MSDKEKPQQPPHKLNNTGMKPTLKSENFWNNNREEIYSWFQKEAPSLGELYAGALTMLYETHLPGWSRFIAHAVREIRNRLPGVISGIEDTGLVQYKNMMDEISRMWEKAGLPLNGSLPISVTKSGKIPTTSKVIPHKILKRVIALIKEHNKGRKKPLDSAKNLFLGPDREISEVHESLRPVIDQWLKITGWFMGKAHDSSKIDSHIDFREFRRQFELFEATLGALLRGFFTTIGELDEILEEANS